MGQKNGCSSCSCARTLFLERLKFSHPVEAEAGIQCGERLCAFPVTPQITSHSIKAQRKESLALLQLQCCSPLPASPYTHLWDPDLDPGTNTLSTITAIHLLHLLVLFPSVPSTWEYVSDANAVNGFHMGKQMISCL